VLVLFTDFGLQGPYVGLVKLALARRAPALPVIDLFHDAPAFDVQGAAYLLAALAEEFPADAVFLGVVDPGVGGARAGLILEAGKRVFIGPDNGLFDRVAARASTVNTWRITWKPERLSASFHGRDLFAPVAAMIATGKASPEEFGEPVTFQPRGWPEDLARIVYIDCYGNALTGIRAKRLDGNTVITARGKEYSWARTFSSVPLGQGFWYENSVGLVELAVNQGSAAASLGLIVGDVIEIGATVAKDIPER
jgi:hypothetical protein